MRVAQRDQVARPPRGLRAQLARPSTSIDAAEDEAVRRGQRANPSIEFHVVHSVGVRRWPKEPIPIREIFVKIAKRYPAPIRSDDLRELSCANHLEMIDLAVGEAFAEGSNA